MRSDGVTGAPGARGPRARRLAGSPLLAVILVATFPVVFLWSYNVNNDVGARDVLLVLGWTLAGCAVVCGVFRLIFGDWPRAALATAVVAFFMFSFGHVEEAAGLTVPSIRQVLLLLGYLLLLASGIAVVAASKEKASGALRVLNLILGVLVVMNGVGAARSGTAITGRVPSAALPVQGIDVRADAVGAPRDVYYLIFDRYAGERTLKELYGYDDSGFIDGLRSRGFSVVDDALANYPQTLHSLASSLNMTYLDDLAAKVGVDNRSRAPLYASIQDFTASRLFRKMGYEYDHVGSWWTPSRSDRTADVNYWFGGNTEFTGVFLRTTALPTLADLTHIWNFEDYQEQQYRVVLSELSAIRAIARKPQATFTFAHITLPHPPYVFAPDGSFRRPPPGMADEQLYLDQLTYANSAIDALVDDLLEGPPASDPIVILQSDEGPHPPELDGLPQLTIPWSQATDVELGRKLRIFNALYLPGLEQPGVYPGITPVNTFRLIFDEYFGADLPLLPDRTFVFTDYDHPYRFEDVTDRLRGPT